MARKNKHCIFLWVQLGLLPPASILACKYMHTACSKCSAYSHFCPILCPVHIMWPLNAGPGEIPSWTITIRPATHYNHNDLPGGCLNATVKSIIAPTAAQRTLSHRRSAFRDITDFIIFTKMILYPSLDTASMPVHIITTSWWHHKCHSPKKRCTMHYH